uniref:Reverse transcriptase zinc-binding domain-containing protein n=1 Tax=Fagus sylvatica TaxID=28930 RepID=A0A2N9HY77_FAGSY
MEALSRLLDRAVREGLFSGFSVGSSAGNSLMISHLLFADDTLIFCGADSDQVTNLRHVFTWFEAVSGLKINLSKSEIVPVGDVPHIVELRQILGCKQSVLPLQYLGLPLGSTFKEQTIWTPVLERVEKRLASWKRLYLSKGARVANRLEKLQRDFLWNGMEEKPKFHLVNGCGGMVRKGRLYGGWWLMRSMGVYGVAGPRNPVVVLMGKVKFWHDCWCGDIALNEAFPELFVISRDKDASIADLMGLERIVCAGRIELQRGSQSRITIVVCVLFLLLLFPWKMIWKAKVPPRIAFFSWSAALGKILTIDNLRKRHLIIIDHCCLCKLSGESVDHLLLHCPFAREMWSMVFGLFEDELGDALSGASALGGMAGPWC